MPEIIYDFDPRNLPPDYLETIGLVTACWAQTDHTVQTFVGACLGVDALYSIAVTAHMAVPLRDGVARAVAQLRIDDLDRLDELDVILDRVKVAADKRNLLAHHGWCRHPKTGQVYIFKETARGTVAGSLILLSVEQIKSDAMFIYETGIDLLQFMYAVGLGLGLGPNFPPFRDHSSKTRAARKARRKMLGKE